jgi:HK97 family phage prohead protease
MKVHRGKDGLDVFMRGCFARSLMSDRAIRFLVQHDEAECLATTADRLELHSNNDGLAFRLKVPLSMAGRQVIAEVSSDYRCGMSVGFHAMNAEVKRIGDCDVRCIYDAELFEISLVRAGAVEEAFAVVCDDGSETKSLKDAATGMLWDWAGRQMQRSVANLGRVLDRCRHA